MNDTTMTTYTYITEYVNRFTREHGLKLLLSMDVCLKKKPRHYNGKHQLKTKNSRHCFEVLVSG